MHSINHSKKWTSFTFFKGYSAKCSNLSKKLPKGFLKEESQFREITKNMVKITRRRSNIYAFGGSIFGLCTVFFP